jgi:hypothetical protein
MVKRMIFEKNEPIHNGKASGEPITTFHEENQQKKRTSALRPGPDLPGHSVQHYEDQHAWVIDQTLIPCTVAEYHCLKLLLERANRCVPFASFLSMQEIFPTVSTDPKQERLRVAHMMSILRAKIWASGLDIVSVMNIGYILLSE